MSRLKTFWVGTACGHSDGNHQMRGLTLEREYPAATLWRRRGKSSIKPTTDGERLVRCFGFISYCEATGALRMMAAADATPEETDALAATGLVHRQLGTTSAWDPSPCTSGERVISLYRYIDDDFIEATVTALFSTDRNATASVDWDTLEQVAA